MAIAEEDVNAVQGATFSAVFNVVQSDGVTAFNLTGYTAKLEIRAAYTAPTPVYTGLSGADLVLGGNTGAITWTMSATETGAIPVTGGTGYPPVKTYYYDLFVTSSSGVATQVCYGKFNLAAAITHS